MMCVIKFKVVAGFEFDVVQELMSRIDVVVQLGDCSMRGLFNQGTIVQVKQSKFIF